jgi:hypothetical protein
VEALALLIIRLSNEHLEAIQRSIHRGWIVSDVDIASDSVSSSCEVDGFFQICKACQYFEIYEPPPFTKIGQFNFNKRYKVGIKEVIE